MYDQVDCLIQLRQSWHFEHLDHNYGFSNDLEHAAFELLVDKGKELDLETEAGSLWTRRHRTRASDSTQRQVKK